MFEVGDEVRIINDGYLFTTYDDFIFAYCPKLYRKYKKTKNVQNGTTGEIVLTAIHPTFSERTICVVKIASHNVILIDEDGLQIL